MSKLQAQDHIRSTGTAIQGYLKAKAHRNRKTEEDQMTFLPS